MKTYLLITQTPTLFSQALRIDKSLDKPLAQAEKWVLCVLMNCRTGNEPDDATRNDILWITKTKPCQWARIVAVCPEKAEIVQAVNDFFYGNLIERSVAGKAKAYVSTAGAVS